MPRGKSAATRAKDAKLDRALMATDPNRGPGTFAQRAAARIMRENGFTCAQIAQRLGVSLPTVQRMLAFKEDKIAEALAARLTDQLPTRISGILDRLLVEMETRDLSSAPLHHLSLLFGTLFDKARIASGKSTNNVSVLVKVQAMADAEEARRIAGKKTAALEEPADDEPIPGEEDDEPCPK